MLTIYNTYCTLSIHDKNYTTIRDLLSIKEQKYKYTNYKRKYKELVTEIVPLYSTYNNLISFPKGLLKLIPKELFSGIDKEDNSSYDNELSSLSLLVKSIDFDKFSKSVNPNITLRNDQIVAIKKILVHRFGLIQLPTGIGKTMIFCGFLKLVNQLTSHNFCTIIMEPTQLLVDSTYETLQSIGIDCKLYSKNRMDIRDNTIYISHPKSLAIDLDKDPNLLSKVKILIGDEVHHDQSQTWKNVSLSCSSLVYNIGLSASAIDTSKLKYNIIKVFDYSEAIILGILHNVLMDIPPSYYINKHILATPVLLRLSNPANEYCKFSHNWNDLRKCKLESVNRTDLVSRTAVFYEELKFKSLVLTWTKDHAIKIMKNIAKYGKEYSDKVRCSFGSKEFYKYDYESGHAVIDDDPNIIDKYKSGEILVLIGTSHIYEGVDIPSLDTVILANVGKSLRRLIQGIGRSLRKSKNGKYAYIIDFTDTFSGILEYHSKQRREICFDSLGIKNDRIYDDISYQEFKSTIMKLENN